MRFSGSSHRACALAALCGLVAAAARGDIIYQDLGGMVVTDDYQDVPIDMDLDGSPDVFARYYSDCDYPGHQYADVFFGTAVDRAFIVNQPNNFFVKGLAPAVPVGAGMNFKATGDLLSGEDEICDDTVDYHSGDWLGSTVKYIGVKLALPSGAHYGWIRVENQTGSHRSFRVLDAGFETTPNTPILTADRGGCAAIIGSPASSTLIAGHTAAVSVVTTGHVTGFQWLKDGVPLVDDGRITGSTGRTLTIQEATVADTARYSVIAHSDCASVESDEAAVRVNPDCRPAQGSEIEFDGQSGYAVVNDSPDLHMHKGGTVEFWIYPRYGNETTVVLSKGGTDVCNNHSWSVEYHGGPLFPIPLVIPEFTFDTASGCKYAFLAAPCGEPDQWTHIAATIDTQAGVMRAFVNGQVVAETTTTVDGTPIAGLTVAQTNWPIGVGRATSGAAALSAPFAGRMDEVRVWTTARSPQQIAEGYASSMVGNPTGLMAFYTFDNEANPGWDATGRGHQGTLMPGAAPAATVVCCPSDFDGSGFSDMDDFIGYVQAFEAGQLRADFDLSGFTDVDDFASFVQAFEAGC